MLEPGTLWTRVKLQTEHALQCGALHTIPTEYEFIEQDGISFLVRIVTNLVRKDEDKKQQEKKSSPGKEFNPFLPYEQNLFVADVSDTHLCLLNKFNVADYHLLIITRAFEEQEDWLNEQDFAAMWITLAEIDGLAFYNGGENAGASQRHKHLQLLPLPLTPTGAKIPIELAIASTSFTDNIGSTPSFPFTHAIARLDPSWVASPLQAAKLTLELYYKLLSTVGLLKDGINSDRQTGAYNLLATREWMMIVPRSQPSFASIAVNSLGFAGALLVRNQEQMATLKAIKPINILKNVAQS